MWDCGWQVKPGDRLVTHGPYVIKIKDLYIKRYINSSVYFLLFCYVTARDNIISISYTTVCLKKTSPTFSAVTLESIVGFS